MATLTSSGLSTFSLLQFPVNLPNSMISPSKPQIRTCNNAAIPSSSYSSLFPTNHSFRVSLKVKSQLKFNCPLISPDDHWGLWSALLSTGAFGLWSAKTKIGSTVSSALVSILMGLAASNLRIIPYEAPAYSIVLKYLLPLTVPLLLFRANMHQLIQSTGRLLLAFLLGSVGTVIGTVVAFAIVPMRSLGADGWKIATALMGSYIGGSVNYIAVSEVLGISPSNVAAGVAADNVICAIYFMVLFTIASKAPFEASKSVIDVAVISERDTDTKLHTLPDATATATAIAVSLAVCSCAVFITKLSGVRGTMIPVATAIVVALATAFPPVFFVVIGASGDVWSVINTAPSIFLFAFVQVMIHLAIILGLGKFFHFDLKLLLLASNANIGGPTTASGMATAKRWDALIVPGILAGIFGIAIATFVSIGVGIAVLKHM
ncbi:putative membrane protein YjcL [Bienertia sinuspersici]